MTWWQWLIMVWVGGAVLATLVFCAACSVAKRRGWARSCRVEPAGTRYEGNSVAPLPEPVVAPIAGEDRPVAHGTGPADPGESTSDGRVPPDDQVSS